MTLESRALLLLVTCLPACFSPDDPQQSATNDADTDLPGSTSGVDSAGDSTLGDPSDPSTTGSSTVDPSGGSTSSGDPSTDGDSSSGDEGSTGSGEDESSTGADAEPACGDGTAQPGEFCITELSPADAPCPPERLRAGDLDGNGRIDLVYASVEDAELGIMLGDGDGGFGSGPAEALSPFVPTLGHFNDDDDVDIAFLDSAIELNVVLNDGSGSLPGSSSGVAVIGNVAVATGDLDGDGYDDVVSVGNGSSIGIALSNGGGSGVLTPTTVGQIGGNALRNGIVVTDLDGNADLDFAFTDVLSGGRVVACRGDGSGAASSCEGFAVGNLPVGLAAGDIDGDGSTDLVAADSLSNTATILFGQGNGAFEDGVAVATGTSPQQVALADLDNDGFDDLVVTHSGDATVRVFLFDPDVGTMGRPMVFDVDSGTPTAADFNGDGATDIAVGNATQSTVSLLLSDA
jgi:hypothetical protein